MLAVGAPAHHTDVATRGRVATARVGAIEAAVGCTGAVRGDVRKVRARRLEARKRRAVDGATTQPGRAARVIVAT